MGQAGYVSPNQTDRLCHYIYTFHYPYPLNKNEKTPTGIPVGVLHNTMNGTVLSNNHFCRYLNDTFTLAR